MEFVTIVVRKLGLEIPVPAEYADANVKEISETASKAEYRGNTAERVILLGVKRKELDLEMESSLYLSLLSHGLAFGVEPTFIEYDAEGNLVAEVGEENEPA